MTEGTCNERLQVERLDRSQPPPGYEVDDYSDVEFHWSAPDEHYDLGLDEHCGSGTKAECMAAAWAHFEAEHDPPGMEVSRDDVGEAPSWLWYVSVDGAGGPIDGGELVHGTARVAAWSWYWRRVALADRLDAEAAVLIEHLDGGGLRRVTTTRSRIVDALRPMLTMADDEDAREQTIAEVERLFSEGRLTFEGDQPIELENVAAWPAALAWPDGLVAAVERWLTEGGEPPEVLRG